MTGQSHRRTAARHPCDGQHGLPDDGAAALLLGRMDFGDGPTMARHAGFELGAEDWKQAFDIPLLVNMQPAGKYLGESFHRAGGVPAVVSELLRAGRIDVYCATVTGKDLASNVKGRTSADPDVITVYEAPLMDKAGFLVLNGNLFDFAIMKTCVSSDEFRERYLSRPGQEGAFECRAVVFDGPDDYHARINDPALEIDERCILVMRGAGPLGFPGSAEVVNMQPPDALIRRGIATLPTLGDGRQPGTFDSPSILNASAEAAAGGGLAWLRTGDRVRIDMNRGRCDMLVTKAEIERRKQQGQPPIPPSQTPWQELYRATVGLLASGGCMEPALKQASASKPRGTTIDSGTSYSAPPRPDRFQI
jgi:dihydroxy-acid dehydratase